jgi:hypothetical protein
MVTGSGPTVLVTGPTSRATMPAPIGSPALLVGIGLDANGFEDAAAAGWRVVPLPPGDDLVESWVAAYRRVGRVHA